MADWVMAIPIWLLGLLLVATMVGALFAGHAFRGVTDRRDSKVGAKHSETQEGYILGGVLSLLALLIGFTYALAIDRFDARRVLVTEDARAIQTLYLRAQLLEEPHRSRFSNVILRYTDNRLQLAQAPPDDARALLADNDRLIAELWAATIPAFETVRGIDFSSALVESVNQVIELDAARKAARTAQIPPPIFALLYLYIVVTSAMLGYVLIGRRGRLAGGLLLALFALALMLMSDINRPTTGNIRESQGAMERLRDFLRDNPPARLDRSKGTPATS